MARGDKVIAETEAAFQKRVLHLARLLGWRAAHFRTVRVQRRGGTVYYETPVAGDGQGFPDLLLCKGGKVMVRELKTDAGRVAAEQQAWLDALAAAGVDAGVWRPRDWWQIEAELRGAA